MTSNPQLPTLVQLDLRLVEADRVYTPNLNSAAANAVDGIVFDMAGNPVEYHVLKQHPGEGYRAVREYDRIPAEAVLHSLRCDRTGQDAPSFSKCPNASSRSEPRRLIFQTGTHYLG